MTKDEITFLQQLDPKGLDGTIQSILLSEQDKLASVPFNVIAKKLIQQLFSQ